MQLGGVAHDGIDPLDVLEERDERRLQGSDDASHSRAHLRGVADEQQGVAEAAVDGAFAGAVASEMPPGSTHTVTFDTAGDFPYYCSTHGTMKNGMNGAIRVVAAS